MKTYMKRTLSLILGAALAISLTGCSDTDKQVVIYTNADEEARTAFQNALDTAGYGGQYVLMSFSTSELGGRLLAEGKNIEADLLTHASYYLESAQKQQNMFLPLTFERHPLKAYPAFYAPTSIQEGAIFVNTKVLADKNMEAPKSFKDMADPKYKGLVSIPNIMSSSTAWLMVQAIINQYGEAEGAKVMAAIMDNAGSHIENSGSGPLKKLRAGEVAIGFGLRQQGVADKKAGLPIDYIDPTEGNFCLTEGVAVVDKGADTNPLAVKMAEAIIKNGRAELLKNYPVAIYEGETADAATKSAHPKSWPEPLTVDLLKQHQEFVNKLPR